MYKRIYIVFLIITFALFVSYNTSKAQFGTTYSTIHTPYGKATIQTPGMGFMPIYNHGVRPAMKKYDYTVTLKSGEVYKGKGKIQLYKHKCYIRFYRGKKFKLFNPVDTKSISMITSNGRKMTGIPAFNDSCWLFKVYEGKINKYAIMPEWGSPYFSAIQKDKNKPPVQLTKEHVIEMVKENTDALKKAKKGKLIDAIKIYNRSN